MRKDTLEAVCTGWMTCHVEIDIIDSVWKHGLKKTPEVIVVDGGSSDDTMKIAKGMGAKVRGM